MENVLRKNEFVGLSLPATYVEVTDQEMEHLDGGVSAFTTICIVVAAVGLAVAFGAIGFNVGIIGAGLAR